jgi:hypothetical protein
METIDAFYVPADQEDMSSGNHMLDDTLDVEAMGHVRGAACHCRPRLLTARTKDGIERTLVVHRLGESN